MAERVNEWLGRREASFDRERRFSTVIGLLDGTCGAELTAASELRVVVKWPVGGPG